MNNVDMEETVKTSKPRTRMIVKDVKLEDKTGKKFLLHYRALGSKRDHFSGYLTRLAWPRNCAISIPVIYGKDEFRNVVNTILDNSEKFTPSNTVGRPRYFDLMSDGVSNVKATNLIDTLRNNHNDFKTNRRSKRSWHYRNISGNFNMRSVKILNIRFRDTDVPMDKLLEYVPGDLQDLVNRLRKKEFVYEKEFVDFANGFIDATVEDFAKAWNVYMGSLAGTVTHRPVKTKSGIVEHYTAYVPEFTGKNSDEYFAALETCKSKLPYGSLNYKHLTIVTCKLVETKTVADASARVRREELVRKLKDAISRNKRKKGEE